MTKLQTQTKASRFLTRNLGLALYIGTICIVGFISPAQADWFNVANIKANLITPIYTLVNENLGFIAFAVGGGKFIVDQRLFYLLFQTSIRVLTKK